MIWHQVRDWFAVDGALRDIVVGDARAADWDRLISAVADWGYESSWSPDDKSAPACARDAFLGPDLRTLSIRIGPARINLHFFVIDEIEMDLDPADVPTEAAFSHVEAFVVQVGRLLSKPVRMTMEGSHECPFMVFDPATGAFTFPTGGA
jgi:hypothetical protein